MVANMKNKLPAAGIPTVNMWWPQTMKDRIRDGAVAYHGRIAKQGLCERRPE